MGAGAEERLEERGCGKGCCATAVEKEDGTAREDGEPIEGNDGGCKLVVEVSADEGCNSGQGSWFCSSSTTSECCNALAEKCIVAVAAVECDEACDTGNRGSVSAKHGTTELGRSTKSPCAAHLQTAFDKYSAYLESAKCICRSVLNRGLRPACCTARADGAAIQKQSTGLAAKSPRLRSSSAACCATESCGSGAKATRDIPPLALQLDGTNTPRDVEKNSELEHVSLAVQGMTCSGCASKLARVMNDNIPAIANVRVNFVMGSAEFEKSTSAPSTPDIVKVIEKGTGFRCTVVTKVDQYLDLLIHTKTPLEAFDRRVLSGILQATYVDKNIVRVEYDPTIIGARTVLRTFEDLTAGLAPPRDDSAVANGRKKLREMLFKTIAAWVLTIPVLILAWGQLSINPTAQACAQLLPATLVQLIAIPEFYRPALSALVYSHMVEMDMLIVISITAAYVYSVVAFGFRLAGTPLETPEFFETSTLLITLVVFSRLVAAYARIRAVVAVSLRSLQPTTAIVILDDVELELDARLLQFGDRFKVLPDSKIPTDGRVIEGTSDVDESMITGESTPVVKRPGTDVIAGTRNISGTMIVQPMRLPGHNTITDIAEMVEQAARAAPKIQSLADRVASYFVPAVSAIALIVFLVWTIIYLKAHDNTGGQAVAHAITYAIAVLAISCPCGIGLAVPMVLVIAGGIAAREGVIIKSADSTERARKVTDVLFDKTGTLTEAEMDVVYVEVLGNNKARSIQIAQMLVKSNKHPVSVAISKHLDADQAPVNATIRTIPGAGIEADYVGITYRGGSPQWTGSSGHPAVKRLMQDKMTAFCVTKDTEVLAVFGLETRIRPKAASVVDTLQQRGIVVHLVSGDNPAAVHEVAAKFGIPTSRVAANCTPAMKRDYVAALMTDKSKTVMFCGDGTNDAVAVTQADVGVQISGGNDLATRGSEVTRGAADVVMLSGLQGIPFLIDLSRAAYRRMVFNFAWSGVYNLLAILMTAGAFVTFRIPPAYAGLGEVVSILPVILAAVTLLAVKIRT
ncbi:copper-transporting P-type ATPase [Coniochaeta sp. 2T2.1]|nr:copper-transporting P-type ATPase [Coniochaeta sp. 2T2.1]